MKNSGNVLVRSFKENSGVYFIVIMFFSIGIAAGTFIFKALDMNQKKDLLLYINKFFELLSSETVDKNTVFLSTVKNNVITLFLIWIFGITVIGVPISLCVISFRGFIVGFTVSFFIDTLGWKGIALSAIAVLPQNLIYIPCLILASVVSFLYSLQIIRRKTKKMVSNRSKANFFGYTMSIFIVLIVMCIGSLLEAYIMPAALGSLSMYFKS